MINRDDIVKQAKSWIGTKFRFQGRIKKNSENNGGVDCLGLIIGVADEVGFTYNGELLSYYDNIFYSKKFKFDILKEKFEEYFYKKDSIKNIEKGDIILQKLSDVQYHLMIYTGEGFIHSSAITLSVVENHVNDLNDSNCIIYSMIL